MLNNWRERVPAWWESYSVAPYVKAREQIAAFQEAFPWQELPSLSIERVGRVPDRRDTLTHALIWGTNGVINLGRVNDLGLWQKDGVWITSSSEEPEEAFARIRDGLYELASLANEGRWEEVDARGRERFGSAGSLRIKPLYLWFPDELAPSVKWEQMGRTLDLLGKEAPDESMIVRNRRLWRALREEPAFDLCNRDTLASTHFFYWDEETKAYLMGRSETVETPVAASQQEAGEVNSLLAQLRREKNVVLTGPPGTGKTWLAQRIVENVVVQTTRTPSLPRPQTWRDALALALYTNGPAKVVDLLKQLMVIAMVESTGKTTASSHSTASNILTEHTPENSSLETKYRRLPCLFDRDSEKRWFLVPEGREYVEQALLQPASERTERSVEFVTFHPSFGYEEFVEGIRPAMDDEGDESLRYEVRSGPFLRMALAAREAWEADSQNAPDFVVIVDEINRADVARVFGDLLALLERSKRLGEKDELSITLPYSGRRLGLPPNLLLLATMNTSDRSVALMDLALRRRFAFVEVAPQPELLGIVADVDLSRLLATINEAISVLLGSDLTLGHAFLMDAPDGTSLESAWRDRAMPQLVEMFHGRLEELEAVLGPLFFQDVPLPGRLLNRFDEPPRRRRELTGEALLTALRSIYE